VRTGRSDWLCRQVHSFHLDNDMLAAMLMFWARRGRGRPSSAMLMVGRAGEGEGSEGTHTAQ
jgi:hypothetical protein